MFGSGFRIILVSVFLFFYFIYPPKTHTTTTTTTTKTKTAVSSHSLTQSLDFCSRRGDLKVKGRRRSRRSPPSCSVGGRRQKVREGHLRPVLDLVGPALSLSPVSASFLDGALNGGFGEGVMSVNMVSYLLNTYYLNVLAITTELFQKNGYTIQLYCLCVEKFAFWLVIYIKTFNKINNKTSTTQ